MNVETCIRCKTGFETGTSRAHCDSCLDEINKAINKTVANMKINPNMEILT